MDFDEIAGGLAAGYRRARKVMPENWSKVGEEELHEFRKRLIDHRHQMEFVEPLWSKVDEAWIDDMQRLRDAIGQHRDLALLAAMAAPRQPIARFRSKLKPAIKRRQKTHLEKAAKIAARVFAEKPKAFRERIESLWLAGAGDD